MFVNPATHPNGTQAGGPALSQLGGLQVRATASQLRYDLAVDPSGRGRPSPVDAGLAPPAHAAVTASGHSLWGLWVGVGILAMAAVAVLARERRAGRMVV